jgi:hypothetical protein
MATKRLKIWKWNAALFSIEHVWSLVVLAGIFIFLDTHPIRPHDFWWHIDAGRQLVSTGRIPLTDIHSFTVPGKAYPSYQIYWLLELMLYSIYTVGGAAWVVFVHSLLVTSAYGLLLWLCFRLSGSWRIAAICTLFAAALGMNDWNVRPQATTFLLASILLWVVYNHRQPLNQGSERRFLRPWGIVAVFLSILVWVNGHGSFVVGLVILGLWLADGVWRILKLRFLSPAELKRSEWTGLVPPATALGVALVACLFNPRGIGVIKYFQTMADNRIVQNLVPEWASPSFDSLNGGLFLAGLLLSATVFALSKHRPNFYQMVTFLALAVLGLRTSRGIVWFGIMMAPVLAAHLPTLAGEVSSLMDRPEQQLSQKRAGLLNLILAGSVMVGVVVSLPWFKSALALPALKAGLLSTETPVEATQFLLREKPPEPLFHDVTFGSYLIWAADQEYAVFVDPRIELYPPSVWQDYIQISAAQPGWEEKLEGYGVNTLMLSWQNQAPLVSAALESTHWETVYQDKDAILLVKIPDF